jgi:integrase
MAVNFQAVVLPHQRKKDGTNVIRIRVTHNRESKWIKSNIVLSAKEQTKEGKPRSKAVMKPAEKLIERMTEVVNSIDMYKLQKMDVEQLVKYINVALEEPDRFTLDFIEYGRKIARKKRPGTSNGYLVAMNALERYFKGRHPDISEITVRNLRGFEQFLREEKSIRVNWRTGKIKETKKQKGGRAVSLYMSALRHIYKCARLDHNDPDLGLFPISNDPFEYYEVPKEPAPRHRNIPIEVVQLMIDTRKRYKSRVRVALDAFLISFGLYGMNAIDMFTCPKPRKRDTIVYNRTKTKERRDDKSEMRVKVEPCIQKIMDDYRDKDRCFDFYRRYSSIESFSQALNAGLKIWADEHKVEKFSFYSARHSWATIGAGKKCNISWDTISAGLCHVNQKRVDAVYINQDWELIWDANKKILGLFKWE